jgi:hypothetical protein
MSLRSIFKKHPSLQASLLFLTVSILSTKSFSQSPNPDFHIYLAFGQSNMEGNAAPEAQDKTGAPTRFQNFQAVDCSALSRKKETWITANAPLCRCGTGITPADYFGRTLADSLPANIKIGVVMVAVAGCKIELFDKANYKSYIDGEATWMQSIAKEYGGNPYARLVELAKLAQKDGVIKGILLHQGESNGGDTQWPTKVKGVYDNLIKDLGLDAQKVPLLAGQITGNYNGETATGMNAIIAKLPATIPTAHVVSSKGVQDAGGSNGVHFAAAGYRELGKRYASSMLAIYAKNTVSLRLDRSVTRLTLGQSQLNGINRNASVTFEISKRAFVSLKVYTLGGKQIAELARAEFSAGHHEVVLNRKSFPNGLCLLKMTTDGYSAARTVLLGAE